MHGNIDKFFDFRLNVSEFAQTPNSCSFFEMLLTGIDFHLTIQLDPDYAPDSPQPLHLTPP